MVHCHAAQSLVIIKSATHQQDATVNAVMCGPAADSWQAVCAAGPSEVVDLMSIYMEQGERSMPGRQPSSLWRASQMLRASQPA
mmetsp:Transcript_95773/g.205493  ORF Transcript_95773/g.205493 Transcript_95773/m.205493 type:complete len:84 (+) Transcript_95773:447-698(+)